MNRNIIRRFGVFVAAVVCATGLVLSAGSTAFAAEGDPIPGVDVKLGVAGDPIPGVDVKLRVAGDPIPGVDVKLGGFKVCCPNRG